MVFENIILVLAGILTALVTGLYFGYSVSVNGGLHRLNDSEYVKAMQSINAAIQNPIFFVSFIGPLLLLPLATFLQRDANSMKFALLFGFLSSIHCRFILSYNGRKCSFKPKACKV
jgi:uncharacterized membrane protein